MKQLSPTVELSLFKLMREHFGNRFPVIQCSKLTLVHLSHTLEDMVLRHRIPALMFTGFQESSHWRKETARYEALAQVAKQVCVFAGNHLPADGPANEIRITLKRDDPLRQEWFVVILSAELSVVLAGLDHGIEDVEDQSRTFDTLWSFDPEIVLQVLDLLEQTIGNYRPEHLQTLKQARQAFPVKLPDSQMMTAFAMEMILFEEKLRRNLLASEQERERLVSRLFLEHHRMSQMIETLPDGIVLVRKEGEVVMTNSLALELLDQLTDWDRSGPLAALAGRPLETFLKSTKNHLPYEITVDHKEGRMVFEVSCQNFPLSDGENGFLLALRDVTQERLIQEREAAQAHLAALGQMSAGIAHDFNNILTTMISFASLIQSDDSSNANTHRRARRIEEQGQRAAKLVRQILDFSRNSVSEKKPLSLGSLIVETVDLLNHSIHKDIRISIDRSSDPYTILADVSQIQQVLTNLILNACDAMPDGGRIELFLDRRKVNDEQWLPYESTRAYEEMIILYVSDNGSGILYEHQAKIFEPFFTTKEVGKGSGLGLSQAYGIMKKHDGHIEVQSAPDKGTVFLLYFPPYRRPVERLAHEGKKKQQGKGQTILLVEDDVTVLEVVEELLLQLGYEVIAAVSGQTAANVYMERPDEISLVISDVNMPKIDGVTLYHKLREHNPQLKYMLITGNPQSIPPHLLQEDLPIMYKPLEFEKLSKLLDDLLSE